MERAIKYFPNECIVCHSTTKLKRCKGCNMIAYCDRAHQLENWSEHKDLCKAIALILKKKGIRHIYEEIANKSFSLWKSSKNSILNELSSSLKRYPNALEAEILKFPRVCFVCREAKQEKLKNCPNCPLASFCDLHPSSELHDRCCHIIKNEVSLLWSLNYNSHNLQKKMKTMAHGTKILKEINDESPVDLMDFYDKYTSITPESCLLEGEKTSLSEFVSISLTIHKILQTIYNYGNYPPEIVIHVDVGGLEKHVNYYHHWEILLHFLPNVKSLKIINIEGNLDITKEISLCQNCKTNKRKLIVEAKSMPYERYLAERNYQKPSFIGYFNISPPLYARNQWRATIERFRKVTCPMVFTTLTEDVFEMTREDFLNSSIGFKVIDSGFNTFAPLMHFELIDDGSVKRNSQFICLIQEGKAFSSTATETLTREVNRPRSSFYPHVCHVCHKEEGKITCNRCRIISYCSNKHRDQDQIYHKDICRVILNLLSEMGTANIFDNQSTVDSDSWLQTKVDVMKKVRGKFERKLEEYEEQMFLFPKACAICHVTDSSLLKSCECGVSLCKIHNKDESHKKLCKELSIAYKFSQTEIEPILMVLMKFHVITGECENSSTTMLDFLKSNVPPSMMKNVEITQEINFQQLATSKTITDSITLLNVITKKIPSLIKTTMTIHILIAKRAEIVTENTWTNFLYLMPKLRNLKIIFIGQQVVNCPEKIVDTSTFNLMNAGVNKKLTLDYCDMNYKEYSMSKKYEKADVILGSNLNIQDFELLASNESDNYWKETILTLEKVGVPFILTAGTKERVEREHRIICQFLGKNVNYLFLEENPFASLCPERDFRTEGVMYANKFLIVYNGKYKESKVKKKFPEEKLQNIDEKSQKEEEKILQTEEKEKLLTEGNEKFQNEEGEKLQKEMDKKLPKEKEIESQTEEEKNSQTGIKKKLQKEDKKKLREEEIKLREENYQKLHEEKEKMSQTEKEKKLQKKDDEKFQEEKKKEFQTEENEKLPEREKIKLQTKEKKKLPKEREIKFRAEEEKNLQAEEKNKEKKKLPKEEEIKSQAAEDGKNSQTEENKILQIIEEDKNLPKKKKKKSHKKGNKKLQKEVENNLPKPEDDNNNLLLLQKTNKILREENENLRKELDSANGKLKICDIFLARYKFDHYYKNFFKTLEPNINSTN
ncbi:reticulocyte-binding protein 2 homolog a-like [Leptopilina heterotoma]|uniref:reticulocyte-binding protein 2 homolog a-like n=1 Tax=Leptopilina heterotoma TaxID=63436 RepID=UPI001CA9B7BE|nr:reticulocyte-binding protein 2 homolog a-like [Leptopilina heterotoma]